MILLQAIGLSSAIFISYFSIPLGWPQNLVGNTQIHLITQCIGLAVTLIFSGFYAWEIAEESRSILTASHAARTALLKQKQLQALGAQAAAAVHELGSPLGTITIIAKELSLDIGSQSPYSEDINLLIDQTKRCQTILRDFGATLRHDPTYLATPIPVADLLKTIAADFLKEKPEIRFLLQVSNDANSIKLKQSAEIVHGIGVFIQNAIQFAQSQIRISVTINKRHHLTISIEDDGSGFAPHILSKLGEPYTSTRIDSGKNMGLGIFIAQTLLEETNVEISYNNLPQGGAQVKLEWKEIL
jgi:two-component system sensor histidine kinase RegB